MPGALLKLARSPSSPHQARSHVQQRLVDWHLDHLVAEVTLLTSELVANAVLHAGTTASPDGDIELRVSHTPSLVRVEVRDGCSAMPHLRLPTEGGRGLHIVEAISTRWGATPNGSGKIVWFEVST